MSAAEKPPKAFVEAHRQNEIAWGNVGSVTPEEEWRGEPGHFWRAATAAAHEADAVTARQVANLYPHDFDHRTNNCPVHAIAEEIAAAIRQRAKEEK